MYIYTLYRCTNIRYNIYKKLEISGTITTSLGQPKPSYWPSYPLKISFFILAEEAPCPSQGQVDLAPWRVFAPRLQSAGQVTALPGQGFRKGSKSARDKVRRACARGDSEEIVARLPCVALGITCGVVLLITCQDTPR